MKKMLLGLLVLLALVLPAVAGSVRNLESPEVQKLMAQKPNLFVLDVRTRDEFRQARLKGAVLIPLNELERRVAEVPKNRTLLVYCAVGARSASAAGFLASKGYPEVYHMTDGLIGWYKHGFPVAR